MRLRLAPAALALALAAACGQGSSSPSPTSQPSPRDDAGATASTDGAVATPVDAAAPGDLRAGAFVIDATPAVGVPIAGYTKRRHLVPDLDPKNLVHWFGPSEGVRDPIQAKALVMESGGQRVAFVSVDTVAILGDSVERIVAAARAKGSSLDRDHVFVFAAHTHSGPGALTDLGFWVQAATDDLVDSVRSAFVDKVASAIIGAEAALAPARYAIGSTELRGVTKNRRVGVSKVFKADDVDPELGVLRVDRAVDGAPIATLYNYGIHGTTLSSANMQLSADVMGGISRHVEKATGAPAIFANGAEADVAPASEGDAAIDAIGALVGAKVVELRGTLSSATKDRARIRVSSDTMDFGQAKLTLRVDGLSSGALDLGAVATILGAGAGGAQTINLDSTMVDHVFHMSAVALDDDVISAVPGEPIHTLGFAIKKQGKDLGFAHVFVVGFANGYMSYVTDKDEYEAGGYEAVATFFGPDTGARLVDACVARIAAVK
ncbi:MAG: neutral/alkaline non-lysosomal ceramidase N-terminal domain-containing protein [Polyangiaceae bacterium]